MGDLTFLTLEEDKDIDPGIPKNLDPVQPHSRLRPIKRQKYQRHFNQGQAKSIQWRIQNYNPIQLVTSKTTREDLQPFIMANMAMNYPSNFHQPPPPTTPQAFHHNPSVASLQAHDNYTHPKTHFTYLLINRV